MENRTALLICSSIWILVATIAILIMSKRVLTPALVSAFPSPQVIAAQTGQTRFYYTYEVESRDQYQTRFFTYQVTYDGHSSNLRTKARPTADGQFPVRYCRHFPEMVCFDSDDSSLVSRFLDSSSWQEALKYSFFVGTFFWAISYILRKSSKKQRG